MYDYNNLPFPVTRVFTDSYGNKHVFLDTRYYAGAPITPKKGGGFLSRIGSFFSRGNKTQNGFKPTTPSSNTSPRSTIFNKNFNPTRKLNTNKGGSFFKNSSTSRMDNSKTIDWSTAQKNATKPNHSIPGAGVNTKPVETPTQAKLTKEQRRIENKQKNIQKRQEKQERIEANKNRVLEQQKKEASKKGWGNQQNKVSGTQQGQSIVGAGAKNNAGLSQINQQGAPKMNESKHFVTPNANANPSATVENAAALRDKGPKKQQTPQAPKVETNPNANPSAHVEQPKPTPQQNPSSIAGAGVQPHYPENFSAPKTPLVYKSQGKGAQNQNHTVAPPTPTNTTTTTPQPSAPKDTTQKTPTPPADNKTTTSGAPKVTAPEQPKAEPTSIPGAGASQKNNQTQSTETTGQTQQTAQTNNNQSTTGGNPSSISGAGATQNQNQNNQNPNQTQTNQGSTAFERAQKERDERMAAYRKAKEEGKSATLGQTMEFWGDKASVAGEKIVDKGGDVLKGVVNAGKKGVTTGVSEGVRRTANIIGGKKRWDQFHEEFGNARNLAEKSEAVARGTVRGLWGAGKRAVAGTAIAGAGALALGGLATYGALSAAKGIARAGMNGASAVGGAIKQAMPNPAMHPPVNQPAPGTVPQSVVHHYH